MASLERRIRERSITCLRFFLPGVLALSLSTVASAQSGTNRIRSFDAVLTVRSDGSLDVTEDLTVQLASSSSVFVRDLSLSDGAGDGSKKLNIEILAVTNEDGQPLRTEEASADGDRARRLRIWIPDAVNGGQRIAIRYRVAGAIHSIRGGKTSAPLDEMRWNLIREPDAAVDSVRARVVLPAGARPTATAVYAEGESAVTDATTAKRGNEVSFTLPRGLAPHQAVTLSVRFPPGYIRRNDATSLRARLVPVLSWWSLLIPLIVFALAFRAWDKKGRDPKEDSQVVRYEPVDGVSPAGLGKLVSNELEAPMQLLPATLVDLAIRGFLRIEETTPSILVTLTRDVRAVAQNMLHGDSGSVDYIIHFARPRSEWKGLKWHEERLLEGLINAAPSDGETKRDSVRVSMLSNKFYVWVPEIVEAIEFELAAKGYYHTRPGKVNLRWITYASFPLLVGGFVSWFFGSILDLAWTEIFDEPPVAAGVTLFDDKFLFSMLLTTLVMIGFAFIMPSRSVAGARAREATLGFKEFLSRVDTIPSVELFERYLPYAIAFGVQASWARAFENIYVAPPSWYSGPMGKFSSTTFGHRISDLCISAATSMSSRPSQT